MVLRFALRGGLVHRIPLLQRVAQALLSGLPAALLESDALLELHLLLRLLEDALLLQDRLPSMLCLGLERVLLVALAQPVSNRV
jgi:hypothetical protein